MFSVLSLMRKFLPYHISKLFSTVNTVSVLESLAQRDLPRVFRPRVPPISHIARTVRSTATPALPDENIMHETRPEYVGVSAQESIVTMNPSVVMLVTCALMRQLASLLTSMELGRTSTEEARRMGA